MWRQLLHVHRHDNSHRQLQHHDRGLPTSTGEERQAGHHAARAEKDFELEVILIDRASVIDRIVQTK